MHSLDDGVIVRASNREPAAIEAIWRALAPVVVGYFRGQGITGPDADDLTSEVFVGVIRRLPGFRGGVAELRTFVFSVAHARLVDEWRRRWARPQPVHWNASYDGRVAIGADPAEIVTDREAMELLQVLTPEQREVIVLRLVADLSIEQVAAVLGRRKGAVKALQHRALETLRRNLDQPVSR